MFSCKSIESTSSGHIVKFEKCFVTYQAAQWIFIWVYSDVLKTENLWKVNMRLEVGSFECALTCSTVIGGWLFLIYGQGRKFGTSKLGCRNGQPHPSLFLLTSSGHSTELFDLSINEKDSTSYCKKPMRYLTNFHSIAKRWLKAVGTTNKKNQTENQ